MKSCCKDALGNNVIEKTPRFSLTKLLSLPFIVLIKIYQFSISPLLGPKCRFTPTCSQYSMEALEKYGVFKGLWLSMKRIGRCNPWGGHGHDPVP